MRKLVLLSIVFLAACESKDERLLAANGIPPEVIAQLPDGVSEQSVGLEGGCYLYDDADGGVVFATDEAGRRICVN